MTKFYLKGRVAPTTPFVSKEPQAAAVPTAPVPNNARERQSSNNVTSDIEVGGPHEKMSFFQIASGPILSIPIHSKVCQYDPCKFLLKKKDPFPTYELPKVSVLLSLVTGLVTD